MVDFKIMKNFFLLILVLFISENISAQTTFGIKSGLNLSKIREKNIDYDFRAGFYAGGFTNIKFAEKFAFQPEVLFSMQGAKIDDHPIQSLGENGQIITEGYMEIDHKLYYLNIPLMVKYYFLEKLNFEFGPQIGFVLKNEMTTKTDELGEISGEPDSNIDLGVNIGLEYEVYKSLGVGVRYNTGLTKIRKDFNYRNSNSVISFGLSYSFN